MTDERETIVGTAGKLLGSLPAQFLMLCLINLIFIGALLWFVDRRGAATERALTPILLACMQHKP